VQAVDNELTGMTWHGMGGRLDGLWGRADLERGGQDLLRGTAPGDAVELFE